MKISYIGLSGLLATQSSMDTSARNIANLLTPGYTRQGTVLASRAAGGVDVARLVRYEDR